MIQRGEAKLFADHRNRMFGLSAGDHLDTKNEWSHLLLDETDGHCFTFTVTIVGVVSFLVQLGGAPSGASWILHAANKKTSLDWAA